jgi:hypothetical protein
MKKLILVKLFNKNNEVICTSIVENLATAKANLAADLDGWDEEAEYGTAELIVFLNIKQY